MALVPFALLALNYAVVRPILRPESLEAWVEDVSRPGYELLAFQEKGPFYFAVFKASPARLVFARYKRRVRIAQSVTTIRGDDDKGVTEAKSEFLTRRILLWTIQDGIVYRVHAGHSGPITLRHHYEGKLSSGDIFRGEWVAKFQW